LTFLKAQGGGAGPVFFHFVMEPIDHTAVSYWRRSTSCVKLSCMEKEIPASLAFLNIEVIEYPRP
jgi:hypothetical protein